MDQADQITRAERLNRMSPGVAISEDTLLRRRFAARAADARVATAKATIASAEASVASTAVTLDRLRVCAPIDGTVLQVDGRAGEPRFDPQAPAWASPRGDARQRVRLTLVRVDPLVVAKVSLTGGGTERVNTRVLRVVYAFDSNQLRAYPGQQMDLFIALHGEGAARAGR